MVKELTSRFDVSQLSSQQVETLMSVEGPGVSKIRKLLNQMKVREGLQGVGNNRVEIGSKSVDLTIPELTFISQLLDLPLPRPANTPELPYSDEA